MSLNVENLLVECGDQGKVAELVEMHLRNPSPRPQPNWGLPSSFEPLLATEAKRKLAISPPRDGWVAIVESKEVIDFSLANTLSEELETTVVATQMAEGVGAAGYAVVTRGQVLESGFNEYDDPLATIRSVLKRYNVPFEAVLFREAVQRESEGWIIKQKKVNPA